ncbi:SIMPL domain-containing protein [Epibacterium ulvae]|nr:SIMPL domain-containing protein [Epibacterium ulvae]
MCVLATAAPVAAESDAAHVRKIQVSGEAQISAVPDMATLTLGVSSFDEEAQTAMRTTSRKMVAVIDTLVEAGIASEDMQTSQLSLSPRWEQDRTVNGQGRRYVVGFEASNMLTIRLFDLDNVGPVLDQVLAVGANHFRGLRFGVQDTDALQDALRVAAVQDAMAKATLLSEAAGAQLGAVRQITDQSGHRGGQMMAMEAARSDFVPIAPGSLEFNHSVSVVFDLDVSE